VSFRCKPILAFSTFQICEHVRAAQGRMKFGQRIRQEEAACLHGPLIELSDHFLRYKSLKKLIGKLSQVCWVIWICIFPASSSPLRRAPPSAPKAAQGRPARRAKVRVVHGNGWCSEVFWLKCREELVPLASGAGQTRLCT